MTTDALPALTVFLPTLAGLPLMKTRAFTPIATTVITRPEAVTLMVVLMAAVGVGVGLTDGVGVGVGVGVGFTDGVGVGVGVGFTEGVGVGDALALTETVVCRVFDCE